MLLQEQKSYAQTIIFCAIMGSILIWHLHIGPSSITNTAAEFGLFSLDLRDNHTVASSMGSPPTTAATLDLLPSL